ncbi:MAG: DUF1524 domain-containing protein [Acidobacteriota bacterium]|nr:DUF1524 domain-containing protein [Acidobacteriota bacterium]
MLPTTLILSIILTVFPAYDRDLYGGWIDTDGDCQNTRQEILIEESLIPTELDSKGCRVVFGQWLDAYTGQTFTNPADVDIDHFIPLAEAHRSGAKDWNAQRKKEFANDLLHPQALRVVSRSVNRDKQDSDPADWLPPNVDFHCEYVRSWILIKGYWDLTMDDRERHAIDSILEQCPPSM